MREKVLVVATSRKTRGGITSVVKAHETGEQWKRFHCKWIETHRDGNRLRKIFYLLRALVEYILLLPFYDIIHIHVGLKASVRRKIVFAKIAKLFRKKIIVHFHPSTEKHLFDKDQSCVIKQLFTYADLLLVLSPQWVRWINEAFAENNFRIQVLYNPCPLVKRETIIKKSYILFAGTLNERKGYNRLLEAFAKICVQNQDWKLIFAGNGEIEQAKKLQKDFGIPKDQVKYLGWVTGEEKEEVFREAAIYCLPSWGEGFPMGVLDAIAYGVPVVTTPVGGITDIMRNNIDALIFDIYDVDMLASILNRLIEDENLRNHLVENADKLKNREFNITYICNQLDQIYANISDG